MIIGFPSKLLAREGAIFLNATKFPVKQKLLCNLFPPSPFLFGHSRFFPPHSFLHVVSHPLHYLVALRGYSGLFLFLKNNNKFHLFVLISVQWRSKHIRDPSHSRQNQFRLGLVIFIMGFRHWQHGRCLNSSASNSDNHFSIIDRWVLFACVTFWENAHIQTEHCSELSLIIHMCRFIPHKLNWEETQVMRRLGFCARCA